MWTLFLQRCLEDWRKTHSTCPKCRKTIPFGNVVVIVESVKDPPNQPVSTVSVDAILTPIEDKKMQQQDGAKLTGLIEFMCFDLQHDKFSKFILFSQFEKILHYFRYFGTILNSLGITNTFIFGIWIYTNSPQERFRTGI